MADSIVTSRGDRSDCCTVHPRGQHRLIGQGYLPVFRGSVYRCDCGARLLARDEDRVHRKPGRLL